jgi:hypothetical protein
MHRRTSILFAAALLTFTGWTGCGPDKAERGLAPVDEEAVPEDASKLQESQTQRQKEIVEDQQEHSRLEFDAAQQQAEEQEKKDQERQEQQQR